MNLAVQINFIYLKGYRIGSMGLNISAGGIVTGNFTVLGKNMTVSTPAVDSSIDATTTTQPFNAVNNVTQILKKVAVAFLKAL